MRTPVYASALAAAFVASGNMQTPGNMMQHPEPRAVAAARAHVQAWGRRDWEAVRNGLAPDVHVVVTSTQPMFGSTDLTGIDSYMDGLKKFAEAVVPGSPRITATIGDENSALLMVTVKAPFGPNGQIVTSPEARLYLLDENGKIKSERVLFFVLAN